MNKKIEFPKDFYWGGAVSAEQTEGKGITRKGRTIYDAHYDQFPSDFYHGVGPQVTSDFTKHFEKDIKMWNEFKFNSHRTSFSWARLFPEGDYTKPNKEAVDMYHDILDRMIENRIEPFITLHHFDIPEYAFEIGGWENRDVWYQFLEYSKFVFNEYGSKVKYFTTMNEPWVPVHVGYVLDRHLPKTNDPQKAINAAYGIVMAHGLVVNYFNDKIKNKFNSKIGGIFNCQYVYPKDPNNKADVKAAFYMDLFQFTGMTDAMVTGKWNPDVIQWVKDMNMIPQNYLPEDIETLSNVSLDLVGLNYYSPARAMAPTGEETNNFWDKYFLPYSWPERRENKFRGWEIYPETVYDTMKELYTRYGKDREYMLTEYGMGVEGEEKFRGENGEIQDDYRISFMKEHLEHLKRFMDDFDVKVIGAHVWATFDNWSWDNGYKNRYGMIEVNIDTQERKPKKSAHFMRQVIEEHGFNSGYKKMEEYINFDNIDFEESKN